MCKSRRFAEIVLTLCLLVFQAQAMASFALGCRHAPDAAGHPGAVCPFHQAGAEQPELPQDCQQCSLHCALGGHALAAAVLVLPEGGVQGVPFATPQRHFYRFTPDFFLKPPISRLA